MLLCDVHCTACQLGKQKKLSKKTPASAWESCNKPRSACSAAQPRCFASFPNSHPSLSDGHGHLSAKPHESLEHHPKAK